MNDAQRQERIQQAFHAWLHPDAGMEEWNRIVDLNRKTELMSLKLRRFRLRGFRGVYPKTMTDLAKIEERYLTQHIEVLETMAKRL